MPYSPIVVGKNPDGTDQTILPFASPFVVPQPNLTNLSGKSVDPAETVISKPYNQAVHATEAKAVVIVEQNPQPEVLGRAIR